MKNSQKGVREALRKKALGYSTSEIVEEWGMQDGSMQLVKRKVTTKDVPPDLSALKVYMEDEKESEYEAMSVEELMAERDKLLAQLKKTKKGEENETDKD